MGTGLKRSFIFSLSDQVLVSGCNFLTLILSANYLDIPEQGKLSYTFIMYMALVLFNITSIFNGASVLVNEETNKEKYRTSLFIYQLFVALVASSFLIAALFLIGKYIDWELSIVECLLAIMFLATQQIADFDRRIKYIFEDERSAFYASLRVYPLRITLLIVFQPSTMSDVLYLLCVANILPIIIVIVDQLNKVARHFDRDSLRTVIKHLEFSKLLIIGGVLGWLWSYMPTFILGIFHGKSLVAILVTLRSITNIANVLMEQVETVSSVLMARKVFIHGKDSLSNVVMNLLISGIFIWVCGFIILYFYGHGLVLLMLGVEYAKYSGLLLIMWTAFGVYFTARVYAIKYRSLKQLHVELYSGIGSLLMAIICIPLIYQYNIIGAGWSYVLISISAISVQSVAIRKISK